MRDNRSLLLGLLSFGLVGTWVYHLYDKNNYVNKVKEIYVVDSVAMETAIKDSLRVLYTSTINQFQPDSNLVDSLLNLKGELGIRMREINKLKNDIGSVLRKEKVSGKDLRDARIMIKDLQDKLTLMQTQNAGLAGEKKRLNGILDMLNQEINNMQQNMAKLSEENQQMAQTIDLASTFMATNMRLAAMHLRSEEKEIETHSVKKADKFVVSFIVQNPIKDFPGAELVIAIKEPSGKIMTGEGWNTGFFDTKTEGKKEYTRKLRFEYTRGEQKRLIFSVQTQQFQKGTYKMHIYHNGYRIGETEWVLS